MTSTKTLTFLESYFPETPSTDSPIYLLRKLSNEVMETYFVRFNKTPSVEVYWDRRHHYKLDLLRNRVIAVDATATHRTNMLQWYTIWEPQRELLLQYYYGKRKSS